MIGVYVDPDLQNKVIVFMLPWLTNLYDIHKVSCIRLSGIGGLDWNGLNCCKNPFSCAGEWFGSSPFQVRHTLQQRQQIQSYTLVGVDVQRYSKSVYKFFHKDFCHCNSFLVAKGYASGHLENNPWPSGGTCSHPLSLVVVPAHLQHATLYCASGAWIFFGGPFLEAHTSQALHQASVSL